MKILLLAINSKYIHSNLAVYSLRAYAEAKGFGENIEIAEYTINNRPVEVLEGIYKRKPDVLAVSCYIWNIEFVKAVLRDFHSICPNVPVWLGGPEVSYSAEEVLAELKFVKGVMVGEGEETFARLVECYVNRDCEGLYNINGTVVRTVSDTIKVNPSQPILNMDNIPFAYNNLQQFDNRIIYYESSRGCPFNCSYCLSSVEKSLRFRSLEKVFAELKFLIDNKVKQVKFVDRTFNCKHDRTLAIWNFIKENDNGITNFHFEVSADLLNEEELKLLASLRPGLVQLEIGVQSANPDTLKAINRAADMEKLKVNVDAVYKARNVHQHLDLIAGLPYENLESFRESFKTVYDMNPDQLQLGFLKVLSGTQMAHESEEYEVVYSKLPPYEVLSTRWLSYDDILLLKGVEEMVEIYYNSGQFTASIKYLEKHYVNSFDLYKELADYYEENLLKDRPHARIDRYNILLGFAEELIQRVMSEENADNSSQDITHFKECLLFDLYLRDNLKSRPPFASEIAGDKDRIRAFYMAEAESFKHLSSEKYLLYNSKQLASMTHMEKYSFNPLTGEEGVVYILFDYKTRNPLSYEAAVIVIKESELTDGSIKES
ncbi:MAG: DUF4080 domain-containing protein [Lachnospiraceae bacterium]|nr:DUF4080 domain-containing protein [Lachnospiraceae bacterium]